MSPKPKTTSHKPLQISRSKLTGNWYAFRSYRQREGGIEVTGEKEDVTPQMEAAIDYAVGRFAAIHEVGKFANESAAWYEGYAQGEKDLIDIRTRIAASDRARALADMEGQ